MAEEDGGGGIFEISLNEFVIGDICFQQKVKVSQKKNKAHFHETRSFKSYLIRLKNNYICVTPRLFLLALQDCSNGVVAEVG